MFESSRNVIRSRCFHRVNFRAVLWNRGHYWIRVTSTLRYISQFSFVKTWLFSTSTFSLGLCSILSSMVSDVTPVWSTQLLDVSPKWDSVWLSNRLFWELSWAWLISLMISFLNLQYIAIFHACSVWLIVILHKH